MLEFLVAFLAKIGLDGLANIVRVRLDTKATTKTDLEVRDLQAKERARESLIQPATIGDVQKYDPKLRQIERAAAAAEAVERAKTATGSDLGVFLRFPRWATFIFAVVIAVLLMLLIWWGVMIYNRV